MNELYLNPSDKKTEDAKDLLLKALRIKGIKITKQRKLVIDIIVDKEFSSCKDIYDYASIIDPNIGIATIYRMVKTLENIGAVNRRIYVNL